MAGEEWAQRILERELEREVIINDDGSVPGMYDLRVGPVDAPEMAIECVGAVDATYTETWNIGPAQGLLQLSSLNGDWGIVIAKEARVKRIRNHVEHLLCELEDRNIYNVRVDYSLKRYDEGLFSDLESLDITSAYCFRLPGTGKVGLEMRGIGGPVDVKGSTVPEWVSDFLRNPEQKDVLDKLARSGAQECQAFVLVEFRGAPQAVFSYLSTPFEHLPITETDLPLPVTGVWIASLFGKQGIRWDDVRWRLFEIPKA